MVLATPEILSWHLFGNHKKNLIFPNEARCATISARSVSHMWHKSQRKCTKYPKKAVIYNYFWLYTYKEAISCYVRTNIFTSIHLVKPLLPVGVEGLHTAFNLSQSWAIAKVSNWHIFHNTFLAKALYMVTVVRLTTLQCDNNSIQFQIHVTYANHWKCLPTMTRPQLYGVHINVSCLQCQSNYSFGQTGE